MTTLTQPEPWLRGPVDGFEPLLMPVVHALIQVREDIENLVASVLAEHTWEGCVATSGLRRQDGPPLASTVPGPPSCPATIRSNGASSNPPSSSSAFGGTCGMP